MRIAMVSEHASPLVVLGGADAGGQNVYVAAVAAELGRRGHEVVVHTRRDDPDTPRRVPFGPNVTVDHVDAGPARPIPKDEIWPYIEDFAADLRRQWEHDRPDVVHAHFWMSGIASLEAVGGGSGQPPTDGRAIPVVQTFHALGAVKRRHQGDADTSPDDRIAAEQRLVAEVDRIVATCSDEAFELRQLGADMDRVSIVPCGVNLENFTPRGPAMARDDRFLHRIATVSRLVPRKGIDDAIRALAQVPDTQLMIAGGPPRDRLADDPEVRRLQEIAAEHGLVDRVVFLGALERGEVPPLLRSSDVLVATPWYEPFGMVPLEGMATGIPVVATAVGGMIDTVADGVTGVHVPPRNPDAIAGALQRLLSDEAFRAELGRAGAARVRARYTWERVAHGIVQAYDETREHAVHREPATAPAAFPVRRDATSTGETPGPPPLPTAAEHVHALIGALERMGPHLDVLERWGARLAAVLKNDGRLLACGNGGSAADAQHLTAELVGRYRDERQPFSAIALHADTSSLTAIGNDYGYDEIFARQIRAHGRRGDVLVAISTSGCSRNVVAAARVARRIGMSVWALTGPAPNELASAADEAISVDAPATATVQEVHGVAIHALCAAVDRAVLGPSVTIDVTTLDGRRTGSAGDTLLRGDRHGAG